MMPWVESLYVLPCLIVVLHSAKVGVFQLPLQNVTLPCSYVYDYHTKYNVKWEKGKKEEGPLLIERDSNGQVNNYCKGRCDLEGCSLILIQPSLEDSGLYSVSMQKFLNSSFLASSASVQVYFFEAPELLVLHDITLAAMVAVSVKIPAPQIALPCNYTLGNHEDLVIIEWRRGYQNGSLVLRHAEGQISYGSQYHKRVNLEAGCSLVISKPQPKDSGIYSVSLRSSNCAEKRANVKLEVDVEDHHNYACTTTSVVILVVGILMFVASGCGLLCTCITIKRYRDDRDTEKNSLSSSSAGGASDSLLSGNGSTDQEAQSGQDESLGTSKQTSMNIADIRGEWKSVAKDESVGLRRRVITSKSSPDAAKRSQSGSLARENSDESFRNVLDDQRLMQLLSRLLSSVDIGDSNEQPDESHSHVQDEDSVRKPVTGKEHPTQADISDSNGQRANHSRSQDQTDKKQVVALLKSDSGYEGTNVLSDADRSSERSSQLSVTNQDAKESTISLHTAVRNGDWDMCRRIIEMGCDLNLMENGETALHVAVERGDELCVDILLQSKAQTDLLNKRGQTVLHIASQGGHEVITKLLIKSGVDTDRLSLHEKLSALHLGAREGHPGVCRRLIKAKCKIDLPDRDGKTALHFAAENGQADVIDILIKAGARTDLKTSKKKTCLRIAVAKNHVEVCRHLIAAGCDVNEQDKDGESLLHVAASKGLQEIIDHLLVAKAKVETLNSMKQTCLLPAAREGHTDICQSLIRAGCNVNHQDKRGQTAIHYAVWKGHQETVEALLKAGARLDLVIYAEKTTCLHTAAAKGYVDICRELIKSGCSVNKKDKDGDTPLFGAASNGHEDVIDLLLQNGADKDTVNDKKLSCLQVAVMCGHTEICERLIKTGCDINKPDKDGDTPLHTAVMQDNVEIIDFLLLKGAKADQLNVNNQSCLHLAVLHGRLGASCRLLQEGLSVNQVDMNGDTPLHLSARRGYADLTKLLIESGATKDLTNKVGLTPLHMAVLKELQQMEDVLFKAKSLAESLSQLKSGSSSDVSGEHVEVCRQLIAAGWNVDLPAPSNWTCLHFASKSGDVEICSHLIEAGCNVNLQKKDLFTALHVAALNGHTDVTRLLLQFKAETDIQSNDGNTPLHLAAKKGHVDIVEQLIKAGAKTDQPNAKKKTCLHKAVKGGHIDICRLLVEAGCDINLADKEGKTPLILAMISGRKDIIGLLKEKEEEKSTS